MSPEDLNTEYTNEELVKRIQRDFSYHAPQGDQIQRYEVLRSETKKLALTYVRLAPASRELSLALTHLENAVMSVNAAIARNEA